MIKAIIIDDEPSAINVLSLLLHSECNNDVQIVATTTSPTVAKGLIEKHHPDLVFADIQMEGLNGIDLVRSLDQPGLHTVFVTAYDTYAIEAFRVNAIDYLLKPIEAEDVVRVIEKVKRRIRNNEKAADFHNLQQLFREHRASTETQIAISMSDRIVFLNSDDIIYCEAKGSYSTIHMSNGKSLLTSKSIGDLEMHLSNKNFFRVHNSSIINLKRVKEFQRNDGGYVVMDNDKKLDVSYRKRKDFLDAIQHMLL